jgi:hypothetical protein
LSSLILINIVMEEDMDTTPIDNDRIALSRLSNRDFVLSAFVPCALWILKRKGRKETGYHGLSVQLRGEIVLCKCWIDPYRLALSIYGPVKGSHKKVFSAYVTVDRDLVDAKVYRKLRRSCWRHELASRHVGRRNSG